MGTSSISIRAIIFHGYVSHNQRVTSDVVRSTAEVIKAIQPFVSPFYDRMPGLISVVDPPFVAKKASSCSSEGYVALLFKEICYGLKNGIWYKLI